MTLNKKGLKHTVFSAVIDADTICRIKCLSIMPAMLVNKWLLQVWWETVDADNGGVKALRWECAWQVPGTALWLEWNEGEGEW